MAAVNKNLASTTFSVPAIYRHYSWAYSIINEKHWYSNVPKLSGVETTWRYVLKVWFVWFEKIKIYCERCRYLRKRTIDVDMSPISRHNMTIAPAFYRTEVDICGPLKTYQKHNKRTTIKISLVVFCCIIISTTSIKTLENYSKTAFVSAFSRFAWEIGYPRHMLIDEGANWWKTVNQWG